uniref:Immunoglobulin domain-containing protein n=1 Tax=Amphiprion percula TaxID=161767 RepID=A0A3P8RWH5_AMPPE
MCFLSLFCSGFTDEQIFETKTVRIGDDVNMSCPRRASGSLFWIKFGSGNFPEILGKTFRSEFVRHRIRVETEPGTLVLYISKAKSSDSAFYYCVKILQQNITFLKGTNLRVEGPSVSTVPPSDPVLPGDSVTLQCSILHDSEKKTCPDEDSMFCCAESHQSHPSLIYTQDNRRDENEGISTKKCFYSYFKNISSSDARTCRCAVVTCVEIFLGNKSSEVNTQDTLDSMKINTTLYLLCAALALSLLVVAFVIYSIKKLKRESHAYCDGKQSHSYINVSISRWQNWIYIYFVFSFKIQLQLFCKQIHQTVEFRKTSRYL